jgi:hypothetical protein
MQSLRHSVKKRTEKEKEEEKECIVRAKGE